MEPFRSLQPLANWLLRLSLVTLTYQKYFNTFTKFSFDSLHYFLALGFVLFSITLIIGGFIQKTRLTVISGLFITVLGVIKLLSIGFSIDTVLSTLPLTTLGFYFWVRGNGK